MEDAEEAELELNAEVSDDNFEKQEEKILPDSEENKLESETHSKQSSEHEGELTLLEQFTQESNEIEKKISDELLYLDQTEYGEYQRDSASYLSNKTDEQAESEDELLPDESIEEQGNEFEEENYPEGGFYNGEGAEGELGSGELKPEELGEEEEKRSSSDSSMSNIYSKLSPFFIKWSYGISRGSKIINLTKKEQFEVFYTSSHFGVIYDYRRNLMRFLPGHNDIITSIAADSSGKWLVTSDSGDDSVIIVWDHDRRLPCWCLYNIFSGKGPRYTQISQDARFLAAVSSDGVPRCMFYLWTYGRKQADGEIQLGENYENAVHIAFNHLNTTQFAITLEKKVVFAQWNSSDKTLHSHSVTCPKRNKIGTFRQTLYLGDNDTAITSSSNGYVVFWSDMIKSDEGTTLQDNINKKYLKAVKIYKTGITSLQYIDNAIVSSSEDGFISFHDSMMSLLFWVPKYAFHSVMGVSCNLLEQRPGQMDPFSAEFGNATSFEDVADIVKSDDYDWSDDGDNKFDNSELDSEIIRDKEVQFHEETKEKMTVPSDCTLEKKPFYMRDFVYLTAQGRIGYVSHHRMKVKYFLYKFEAPILSMDCNPQLPHLAVANSMGTVTVYEEVEKRLLFSSQVTDKGITALKYSPQGRYLIAGLANGTLLFLDPFLLKVTTEFKVSTSEIVKICISSNEKLVAYFDKGNTVFLHCHMKSDKKGKRKWVLIGGYGSHHKPVKDIMFEEEKKENETTIRLFTIGEDRMLVEYDLQHLEPGYFKIKNIDRIEQTALPQCFTILPKAGNKTTFLICNNEYKFKELERDTKTCIKTTVGPTADTPATLIRIAPTSMDWSKVSKMIYTTERHIGMLLLPLSGNPFEGIGVVGHPVKMQATAISRDFKHVYTCGVDDTSILTWQVNSSAIELGYQLGGTGIEPFLALMEGGVNGPLFQEFQDFFYYCQIVHQGEYANLDRSVNNTLALCEIPDLFRSLGFYPTEYEISNLFYEVSHMRYEETGELIDHVTFEDAVKVFLNHRPVKGITIDSINKALLAIADLHDPECVLIERNELYKALEENGEKMSHAEVVGYLCILLLPKDEKEPLAPVTTLTEFAEDVLGVDLNITHEQVREITHSPDNK